jgi:DNA-binding beta-propeller fold protein YncE
LETPRERTFWMVLASLVLAGVVAGSFSRRGGTYPLTLVPGAPPPRPQEARERVWNPAGFERIATVQVGLPTLLRPGPGGDVYVLDSGRSRVLRLSPEGRILTTYGDPSLGNPTDVAIGADGEVWVCDLDHSRIAVFSAAGKLIRRIEIDPPVGRLTLSPGGGFVATSIAGGQGLFRRYFLNGEPTGAFGALFPEELQTSIAADGWIVPGSDGFFYPFRNAGLLISYGWDGRLRFFRQTIDPVPLPSVRMDAAGRQSVPDATLVSISSSVVGGELYILTGGKDLDVYDVETGSYRYSLRSPENDARYIVLTADRLYSASGRGVTVWRPRNPLP